MAVVDSLGVVFVGTRSDSVYAVIARARAGRAERVDHVLEGLKVANGIGWKDGWLYVAEQHRVVRFRAPDLKTLERAEPEMLFEGLPKNPWHGWSYARFEPDGRFYIAVGSPYNVCRIKGMEGTIVRMAPEGGKLEIFAAGVRNSVGFDFQPKTGDLYFTDNGADRMGDDEPPDELNHVTSAGQFFGFPYFGGGRTRTSQTRGQPVPAGAVAPAIEFQAHTASLGLNFYRGTMFPAEYRNDAFVAQHGSWNRSTPIGYRIMRVRFNDKGKATCKEIFADGWLQAGSAWEGRWISR